MTKDEAFAVFKDAVATKDQLKEIYVSDLNQWRADKANAATWQRMTTEQKQRVADLWKAGKGLYTFESCVRGVPEFVFPPF